jgi:atypical dual specificity phosphatase
MNTLNFGWVIDGMLAGHAAPRGGEDLQWLKEQGIRALVRLTVDDGSQVRPEQVATAGLSYCHEPVPGFQAPEPEQIDRAVAFISDSLAAGKPVGVCCFAGYGRTGTMLACYLVSTGMTAEAATGQIRQKRPGSVETKAQQESINGYERRLRHNGPQT